MQTTVPRFPRWFLTIYLFKTVLYNFSRPFFSLLCLLLSLAFDFSSCPALLMQVCLLVALPLWPQPAQLCPHEAHTLSMCLSSAAALCWLGMSCVQHFTRSNTVPHGTDETVCPFPLPSPELARLAARSALGDQPLRRATPCACAWCWPSLVWPFLSLRALYPGRAVCHCGLISAQQVVSRQSTRKKRLRRHVGVPGTQPALASYSLGRCSCFACGRHTDQGD